MDNNMAVNYRCYKMEFLKGTFCSYLPEVENEFFLNEHPVDNSRIFFNEHSVVIYRTCY